LGRWHRAGRHPHSPLGNQGHPEVARARPRPGRRLPTALQGYRGPGRIRGTRAVYEPFERLDQPDPGSVEDRRPGSAHRSSGQVPRHREGRRGWADRDPRRLALRRTEGRRSDDQDQRSHGARSGRGCVTLGQRGRSLRHATQRPWQALDLDAARAHRGLRNPRGRRRNTGCDVHTQPRGQREGRFPNQADTRTGLGQGQATPQEAAAELRPAPPGDPRPARRRSCADVLRPHARPDRGPEHLLADFERVAAGG
jgi:hypothetical protein